MGTTRFAYNWALAQEMVKNQPLGRFVTDMGFF